LTLLDYPDSEGITRELVVGDPGRAANRKALLAVMGSTLLVLAAIFGGRAVLLSSGMGPAPNIHVPLPASFPPLTASSLASSPAPPLTTNNSSTPLAITLNGTQLTPSVVPVQNAATAASPTPSALATVPRSSSATSTRQTIVVQYIVVPRWNGGFEGEVRVVNNGSSPISDWQIAVALPDDQITSFWGASGYVSNHILLMQPASYMGPLAAGAELSVFFEAQGTQKTPELCAFNNIACE
jgi:hypothetical protein